MRTPALVSLDGLLIFSPYRASYMCMIATPFARLMVTMTLAVCIRIALGYWAAHEEKRVALSPEALMETSLLPVLC